MLAQKLFEKINWRILNRFKYTTQNPEKVQESLLFRILKNNENCEYGKKFGFSKITSIEEFQRRIPIVTYEDLEDKIERIKKGESNILTKDEVIYFATTTGSTGRPKFIPITRKRLKIFKNEYTLWAIYALRDHPQIAKGKTLALAGSYFDGETEAGIPHGSISGYYAKNLPWYIKSKLVIPPDIYNIRDFDKKINIIAHIGLENNISQLGLASPVEVLLLFNYIGQNRENLTKDIYNNGNKERGKELDKIINFIPKSYWPNLSLLNYLKGGYAQFYLKRVRQKVGDSVAIRDPGISSSEGKVSICLSDEGTESIIAASSNFFEFMEFENGNLKEPITHKDLELGKDYSVLLTTPEGLYRYDLGDIVKVTGFYGKLPVVEFVDRRDIGLSIVGEHVTESELLETIKEAVGEQDINLVSFTTIPNIDKDKPRYEFLVEGQINEKQAHNLLAKIENGLQSRNFVYRKMRQDYGRLDSPLLSILKEGSYNKLDKERIQERGSRQIKPINISHDPNFREKFQIESTYTLK